MHTQQLLYHFSIHLLLSWKSSLLEHAGKNGDRNIKLTNLEFFF